MPRLFVPPERLQGTSVALGGEAHRHLVRVLRLTPGDAVTLFDGRGGEVEARVSAVGARSVTLALGDRRTASTAATATIVLLQGLPKGDRMDWVVQKTTELGVSEIVPVVMARSVARPAAASAAGKTRRWQTLAAEAARQSGRADLPEVRPPTPLTAALAALAASHGGARRLALWEGAHGRSLTRALADGPPSVVLLVGPEGGLAPEEVQAATAAGFEAVTLGPRILRTETAAIVAVALAQAAAGGLGS